jgi:superfamily II DNA/RNA helicase
LKFQDLDLHPEIIGAIEKLGYKETTPIQESTMPLILEGKDVAGLAQTGTGKTAAFVCPLLDRLFRSKNVTPEQAADEKYQKRIFPDWKAQEFILVLVPTRELVDQVVIEIEKLRGNFDVKVLAVYGGTGYEKQLEGFKNGVDFVVGTPGRLIDLYKTHAVDFRQVRAIVFDEADRMFDMGFRDDMKFILRRVPKTRQFLVFSATLNFEVLNTAYMHGADPVECNVSRDQAKAENVKDEIYHCGHTDKPQFLISTLKKHAPKQVIIFSNFKHNVERIAQFLNENDYPAVAISSLLTQAQRNRVMEQFKGENHLNIMVATDLAARGLDIKGVDLIVNFELPDDPENYVHRIGRTGRAGAEGKAISFVGDRDVEALQRIEDYLKHKVSVGWMEDTELLKDFKPFPMGEGRMGRPSHGGDRGGRPQGGPRRDSRGGGGGRGPRNDRPRGDRPHGDRPRGDRPPRNDRPHQADRPPQGDRPQGAPQTAEEQQQQQQRHHEQQRNRPRHDNRNDRPERSGPNGQHRDRAMGRHGRSADPAAKQENGPRQEGRPQRHDNRGDRNHRDRGHRHAKDNRHHDNRKPSGQGQPQRRPLPATKTQDKSVTQKITGFFKGLFGR